MGCSIADIAYIGWLRTTTYGVAGLSFDKHPKLGAYIQSYVLHLTPQCSCLSI